VNAASARSGQTPGSSSSALTLAASVAIASSYSLAIVFEFPSENLAEAH
jgi:hypothetical protein